MTGVLAAQGIRTGVTRVGQSLLRVNPENHERRKTRTERQQTLFEKLILFGITRVCAVDGYSGMIVAFATFPIKNNALIYEHLYKLVTHCAL